VIDIIADAIATAVHAAVEGWISEFETILHNPELSSMERLRGINEVVTRYRFNTTPGEQLTSVANG
jgi:hypothetical protein